MWVIWGKRSSCARSCFAACAAWPSPQSTAFAASPRRFGRTRFTTRGSCCSSWGLGTPLAVLAGMTLLVPNCVNLGRIVNRGGALRLALLAALLVPFANLGGLYRVGLPSALACSAGAGPAPGVTSFYAFGARESNEMAVANDGLFAIEVVGRADSAEATLAAINVRVTNSAGDAIDGTLKNFASRPSALFWTANAPLPDATYTAIVSARSNADLVPLELQLHAKGERAP